MESLAKTGQPLDLALGKKVLEYCNHSHYLTDEIHRPYDNRSNYCATHWPGYITIDIEGIFPIRQISFQLWDYEDSQNITPEKEKSSNQVYAYRLLCSEDKNTWDILYDTANTDTKYRKGWQTFKLSRSINTRYIRIHAVHNKKNSGFHVVRLHAFTRHNQLYDHPLPIICTASYEQEVGDGYPISYQLLDLSGRIQDIITARTQQIDENGKKVILDESLKQKYSEVIDYLFEKSTELDAITGKIDEVRKLVTEPVGKEFRKFFTQYNKEQQTQIATQFLTILIWLLIQLNLIRIIRNLWL